MTCLVIIDVLTRSTYIYPTMSTCIVDYLILRREEPQRGQMAKKASS